MRPPNPKLVKIQREGRARYIARLMLLGLDQEPIARRCRVTTRTVRYIISTSEYELIYSELQRERDQRLARLVKAMDDTAVKGLQRRLTDKDPRIQLAAIELFYRLRGKGLEKLGEERPHTGVLSATIPMDDLAPEQRDATRVWLTAMRKALPPPPSRLIQAPDMSPDGNGQA